jgi:hypothetical protein
MHDDALAAAWDAFKSTGVVLPVRNARAGQVEGLGCGAPASLPALPCLEEDHCTPKRHRLRGVPVMWRRRISSIVSRKLLLNLAVFLLTVRTSCRLERNGHV